MRILQLVESAGAGVGRHVLDLTAGLLDREHEVHLLYSPERANAAFRARLDSLCNRNRCFVSQLPMQRGPHWTDLQAVMRLRTYARRRGPFDAAHFHSSKAGLIGRLALAGAGIRRVYTPHALYTLGSGRAARAVVAFGERFLARVCEDVILVSSAEFDHAVSIGLPGNRLHVIHPGITIGTHSKRNGDFTGDVRIGFVGRLVEQKAPETLLAAFQILASQWKRNARLLMVGEGPLRPRLQTLAARLGIADRVTWMGALDGAAAMRRFDIFALTSRYEGFPYVILEAMSAALPIVATRVGGTSETIRDGENGFLAPVGGAHAIARALAVLVDDASLRDRMGSQSRRMLGQFTLDRMIDRTLGLYRTVRSAEALPALQPGMKELNKGVRG